jgi:hypothetical protein
MKLSKTLRAIAAGLVCLMVMNTLAAEWQWSVPLGNGRAFLWIPPKCRQVRAVVVGQNNMIEEGILQHDYFRKQMAKLGIAEIYIAPPFETFQNSTNNDTANAQFDAMLKSLAGQSGYGELEFAPILPIGHSAMASYPWNFAAWNPARTLAILSVHGDAPQTTLVGNGRPNVDWGNRNIDGVPGLMVMGEYEWWEDRLAPATKFRAAHPAAPVALLADAGHGHFDYSDELVHFLALFIRKAAELRLPANLPGAIRRGYGTGRYGGVMARGEPPGKPVGLKPVDPKNGWLTDRWRKDEKPRAQAAPFARYTGDAKEAFWCFDREMARATENFNPQRGKLPQLVAFVQDDKIIEQRNTHSQINLKFEPAVDGVTFKLATAFLDDVPGGSPNPAKWTGLTNGAPLGHARPVQYGGDIARGDTAGLLHGAGGGGPIVLSRISGPVEQLDKQTFAVRFNRASISSDRRAGDIWLLASHPGDAKYKSAVQQALLVIPFRNQAGAEQHITFPEIPDQPAGTKSLKLPAASDSGLPVYYYVREGPAEIDGDTLKFTQIPPRAKFPLKVTVVAWQYGRSIEPKLKSADPVERNFNLVK